MKTRILSGARLGAITHGWSTSRPSMIRQTSSASTKTWSLDADPLGAVLTGLICCETGFPERESQNQEKSDVNARLEHVSPAAHRPDRRNCQTQPRHDQGLSGTERRGPEDQSARAEDPRADLARGGRHRPGR